MNSLRNALQLLSIACLGIFAGAMLTEGFLHVPYWRSLPPSEFFAWYAANDERLLGFFRPLTIVTAVVTLLAAVVSVRAGDAGRWGSVLAAALILAAVGMFFVYFEAANAGFSAASVAPADLPAELARWGRWHAVRTVMSLVALAAALLSWQRGT